MAPLPTSTWKSREEKAVIQYYLGQGICAPGTIRSKDFRLNLKIFVFCNKDGMSYIIQSVPNSTLWNLSVSEKNLIPVWVPSDEVGNLLQIFKLDPVTTCIRIRLRRLSVIGWLGRSKDLSLSLRIQVF